jgi:general secretion pathway protein D
LDVSQELSIPGAPVIGTGNLRISTRKAETSLVAESGQTILIGGLIRSAQTESGSGFPVLRDVPILGYLFGSRTKGDEKTELILLITPHVIQSREDADAITREFTAKVKGLTDRFN